MQTTTIRRNSALVINKEEVKEEDIINIKEYLTRVVPMWQNSPEVILYFYLETSKQLIVPRYFPINLFIDNLTIKDETCEGEDIKINHHITLRDDLQKSVTDFMLSWNSGIIQAPPGSGKTIMSVYVISELKKKTLILVHRDSLAEQWIGSEKEGKGFLGFTDISENDIGRLSSSNFKECLKKSIVIATVQTISSMLRRNRAEFHKEIKEANFGICISDECHTATGAPVFSECSLYVNSKRTFGLSATPSRKDGTTDIIRFHLGEVFIPEGKSSTMDARVSVLLFNYEILASRKKYIYWDGFFQRARYLNMLRKSDRLLAISLNQIKRYYSEGRNIIYVSDRINLMETLDEKLKDIPSKSMFIKNAKNNVLSEQLSFATTSKIRDGVDAVAKDCLIMPNPVGNIEQLCGRILRLKEGKKTPGIVDMVDIEVKDIRRSFKKRNSFYKEKGWNVTYTHIHDDNRVEVIDEKRALDLIGDED